MAGDRQPYNVIRGKELLAKKITDIRIGRLMTQKAAHRHYLALVVKFMGQNMCEHLYGSSAEPPH